MDASDRARALSAVEAALAIDPEFLAAQSLRDRIIAWRDIPLPPPAPVAPPVAARPLVSAEGYARFEERARRRRVDKRIEAARSAIERRKLREAASALDEVIELDPNMPELAGLTAEFDELRRSAVHPDRGPWVAAALVFGTMVLAASWIEESRLLQSRAVTAVAPLVATAAPEPIVVEPIADAAEPTGTAGERSLEEPAASPTPAIPLSRPTPAPIPDRATTATQEPAASPSPSPQPPSRPPAQLGAPSTSTTAASPAPMTAAPIQDISAPLPPPRPAPVVARNIAEPPPALPPVVPATPVPTTSADELQVKQVLQRYRVAYEGLDARSAQAVWPAVNQVALARAFDGLESQRLTFEACNVELQGSSHALATCRGTARYVPKIGSRQPRIEPRIWSFALRKIGAEWKIDNARAER
jgi:hypothetical protein